MFYWVSKHSATPRVFKPDKRLLLVFQKVLKQFQGLKPEKIVPSMVLEALTSRLHGTALKSELLSKLRAALSIANSWLIEIGLKVFNCRNTFIQQISHNEPNIKNTMILFVCLSKILHMHCFQFLLGPL